MTKTIGVLEVLVDTNSGPPQYGYRSYAELIKQYLIYGRFYAGWSKLQGQYLFRVITRKHEDGHYGQHEPVGFEMVYCGGRHVNIDYDFDAHYVLRIYADGTALWRPWKLSSMRYNAVSKITNMIEYFFYRDGAIRETYSTTHVLRRKAINPHFVRPTANHFGKFLEHKYNGGTTDA